MSSLTVHDILGTIEGLTKYSVALSDAAQGPLIKSKRQAGVIVDPVALAEISVWLLEAGNELKALIPDGPLMALKGSSVRQSTLVRVVGLDAASRTVQAILPGWDPDEEVTIKNVPLYMIRGLTPLSPSESDPVRCSAWVNLGAQSAEELTFSDWGLGSTR